MERRNNTTFILDYKTGTINRSIAEVSLLFDRKKLNEAATQALAYSRLLHTLHPNEAIVPGLYGMKEIFGPAFDPRLVIEKNPLADYRLIGEPFALAMDSVLADLFLSEERPSPRPKTPKPAPTANSEASATGKIWNSGFGIPDSKF